MPRLPRSLLRIAYATHPCLPLLLPACRDIPSATSELRWLREHVLKLTRHEKLQFNVTPSQLLRRLLLRRRSGEPLQYILGSQPFGSLEILCKKGVLIPRWETEGWTLYLAELLLSSKAYFPPSISKERGKKKNRPKQQDALRRPLRILDLCAGTGCISLSLYALLWKEIALSVVAVDISPQARNLALRSLKLNQNLGRLPPPSAMHEVGRSFEYKLADITSPDFLESGLSDGEKEIDILVANPPYISPASFDRDTSRSARNWEPKRALVPPPSVLSHGDAGKENVEHNTRVTAEGGGISAVLAKFLNLNPSSPTSVSVSKKEEEGSGSSPSAPDPGDTFYTHLLSIALKCRAKILVMEVADSAQALRVLRLIKTRDESGWWDMRQIWCDEVGVRREEGRGLGWGGVEGGRDGDGEGEGGGEKGWRMESDLGVRYLRVGRGNARAVVLGKEWGYEVLGRIWE